MAKKNKKLLNISLIFVTTIFILSTLASVILYRQDNNQDTLKTNFSNKFYEFKLINDRNNYYYLVTSKEKDNFIVSYLPYDIMNNINKTFLEKLRNENSFYLVFDPDDQEISIIEAIRFELSQNTGKKLIISGILNSSESYSFLPVINCENSNLPVLILKTSNVSKSNLISEHCLELNFVKFESVKIRDLLIYISKDIII